MAAQARALVQSMTALREAGNEEDIDKKERETIADNGDLTEWSKTQGVRPVFCAFPAFAAWQPCRMRAQ